MTNRLASVLALGLVVSSLGVARAGDDKGDGVRRLDLGGAWVVSQEGKNAPIPAVVPGCVHTDLLAAKKIPDPFYRDHEKNVQWVGEANWIYRRTFHVEPSFLAREHVLLRCNGLDTLATIRLNGHEVARTNNMFRTYEFDVKKLLQPGENTIEIKFDSVLPFIRDKEKKRPLPTWAYPGAGYVRKVPCNFGWDWGASLVTCGIWRDIALVAFDTARWHDVAIVQEHAPKAGDAKGKVTLHIQLAAAPSSAAALKAKVTVRLAGKDVASTDVDLEQGRGTADIVLDDPKLWWPVGMGGQPLYTVQADLFDAAGHRLDSSTKRIGLRTLQAVPQKGKEPMHFVVNGVPFFAKGANWIPADCFYNRVTKDILRRYMEDAVASNMNMIRLWGGGYYEEDALYDLCDELGICLWVDFKFGCSTYPAFDPAFLENVRQEARDNLRRLRHHPSIAVWCGNNEIMAFRGDRWTNETMSADDYYRLFRDTLGNEVRRLSPGTDYVTGSPDCGDVHFWQVWHGGKPFDAFNGIHGFVSEFGFQAFPQPKTIRAITAPEDRASVFSDVMKHHERSSRMYLAVKGDAVKDTNKILLQVHRYFREPKDFESTLWLSQITQGYVIKWGAEGWRREWPQSTGCVYWQFNDCWPVTSWSSIDYFGRWKALQYMAKRFYAPLLVSGVADAAKKTVDLYVCSDRMEECEATLDWTVTTVAGEKLLEGSKQLKIPARTSQNVETLALADEVAKHGANNVLVWMRLNVGGAAVSDNLAMFVYPKELDLLDPKLSAEASDAGQGRFTVTLKAEHPALWAWLELDDIDARMSQNFVHVAPGVPVSITVRPASPMDLEAFQKALRVRSLYDTYAH